MEDERRINIVKVLLKLIVVVLVILFSAWIVTKICSNKNPINSDKLVDDTTAYLTAFRTNKEYEGKGYFSKLYKFMEEDLKNKGYTLLTLGVEPEEIRNKEIYKHYGFVEHIKNAKEVYPDGTKIDVEYYGKKLK